MEQNKKTYTCPMHPEIVSETPGMCPECGMALVPTAGKPRSAGHKDAMDKHHDKHACCADGVEKALTKKKSEDHRENNDKHAGHKTNEFLVKFWVSLALTIPIVWLYLRAGNDYIALVLASAVFWYCGWVFLVSAWRELRGRAPGMMTLIAIAIIAAYIYSAISVLLGKTETLFWELSTLITIMLLGHYLEMRAVKGAQGALRELSKLLPDEAEIIKDGKQEVIPLSQLKVNDLVFIRPGGRVPADGLVEKGQSHVDESMMTGESKPVAKKTGDQVVAGTINGDGSLTVRVTKIGKDTFLSGVMRLVAQAQASKSRVQLLADRAAFYLTIIAVIVGTITLVAWIVLVKDWTMAVERLVAVLVIACPHALGLAVPLIASISTTKAARSGFLVRERRVLEAARTVDVVVFDKTGTLTTGTYGVTSVQPLGNTTSNEVLALAASVDSHSEHFIAKAIVAEAKKRNIPLRHVDDFKRVAGKGVSGVIDKKQIMVGGEAIVSEAGSALTKEQSQAAKNASKGGKTIVYVIVGGSVVGYIALADIIRQESKEAITALKASGVSTVMITGDSDEVAQWVSEELGLDRTFARVLPDQKAARVKELQAEGKKVAMVGDGINDAPALTQADVGIAIGAGTNVAIESAGIILVKNDPRDIVRIIKLSRRTYAKMIQNLWWAAGYNIVAMPLAAGVLASYGILLQPAIAALLMSVSTVVVAANAMLLRKEVI